MIISISFGHKRLLKRLTVAHNAEVQRDYDNGLLDDEPQGQTPLEMLETILFVYALQNYPQELFKDYQEQARQDHKQEPDRLYTFSFTAEEVTEILNALNHSNAPEQSALYHKVFEQFRSQKSEEKESQRRATQ